MDDEHLFERFVGELAHRQLAEWLPPPSVVLDLSDGCPRLLGLMLDQGHTVVHVTRSGRPDIAPDEASISGRLLTVMADPRLPNWLAAGSIDCVVAEGGMLSAALAAELTLESLHRLLRPGGRLLVCVDSLVAGLAQLADQGRWAELADVPSADVVLIPGPEESVTRCFWPEELQGMLTATGYEVDWIRPRTVLADETVTRALRQDPGQLDSLVMTELALEARRQGESIGARLVASARKACPHDQRADSRSCWQSTQRAASGLASRRSAGISLPQST